MKKSERNEFIWTGEERASGRPYCSFSIYKEGIRERKLNPKKKLNKIKPNKQTIFLLIPLVRGQEVTVLN